jgi:hypothetical protein
LQIKQESARLPPPNPAARIFQPIRVQRGLCAIASITILRVKVLQPLRANLEPEPPLRRIIGHRSFQSSQPTSANDMQWVREQTFSGLTDAYAPRKRG